MVNIVKGLVYTLSSGIAAAFATVETDHGCTVVYLMFTGVFFSLAVKKLIEEYKRNG